MANHFLTRLKNKTPVGLFKILINLWPPFFGAAIRINKISKDYRHIVVSMKMKWYNKNYVGSHFGGSLYAMTDPFHMLMLLKNLGSDYIVWDKAGHIEYKKPGKGIVKATFKLSEQEIQRIREQTDKNKKYIFDQCVDVIDQKGDVIASITKTVYVRKKSEKLATLLSQSSHST